MTIAFFAGGVYFLIKTIRLELAERRRRREEREEKRPPEKSLEESIAEAKRRYEEIFGKKPEDSENIDLPSWLILTEIRGVVNEIRRTSDIISDRIDRASDRTTNVILVVLILGISLLLAGEFVIIGILY